MSIEIADENGPFDQVASNSGYSDLIAAGEGDAVLDALFEHGATTEPDETAAALRALAAKPDIPEDVKTTARNLANQMEGRKFIFLTGGMGPEEDETAG